MITNILIPTDASASAQGALALAADLAGKYGAKLTILHNGFRGGEVPDLEQQAEAAYQEAKAAGRLPERHPDWSPHHRKLEFLGQMILDRAKAEAVRHGAGNIETLLDFGDDAERILHHARHDGIDMIVMGSRGHNELEGLLLGSVSQKVQHLAPCTTILVREPGPRPVEHYETILVATDGSEHANLACELAGDIALKASAKLIFVQIPLKGTTPEKIETLVDTSKLSQKARDDLRLGSLPLPIVAQSTLEEVGQTLLKAARERAERQGVKQIETILEAGDPARTILDLANARHVDLIVMGSRGVGLLEGLLLGSASNKVSHLAKCPVVVVR